MGNRGLESRLYASQFSTGLLELLAGLGIVLIGFGWLADLVALSGIVPMLIIFLWRPLNDRLVTPRIGSAVFGEGRRSRERRGHLALIGVGVLALALGIAAFFLRDDPAGLDLGRLVVGLPASILAIGAVVSAALFGLERLYWYAVPLLGAGALGVVLEWHPGWVFIAAGAPLVVVGSVIFGRFLSAHPVRTEPTA